MTLFRSMILFSICLLLSFTVVLSAQNVEIKNGWYYIGGEKFFVKGIGYETNARPGQVPWNYNFDKEIIEFDLERIKDAGFNTIRTWGALREEELSLIEASGLKIIFGIWIDPHGDYGDPSFNSNAIDHVESVMEYSKNYSCIIGYLIMNEPVIDDIENGGAQNLSDLWDTIISIIHSEHPGIPVSFANTIVGDFIDMSRFDFSAYNAYIYNPKLFTDSHGYSSYLKFLKLNRSPDKPMVVTEFGLSVSPDFYSPDYSYGGNTLEQQTSGDLKMYRDIIDADLQGGCVFQYHDGWWKAGDEFTHNETAEEWFGLISFSTISDRFGTPRPVWDAFTLYNKAIITNPKNGHDYTNEIPIEIFPSSDVKSFTVSTADSVIYSDNISGTVYNSELNIIPENELKDLILKFDFYDVNNNLLKTELITVLLRKDAVIIPELKLEVIPEALIPGQPNTVNLELQFNSAFQLTTDTASYVMFPHIGWDSGTAEDVQVNLANNIWNDSFSFTPPSLTKVVTYGAGASIKFGSWERRLTDQLILRKNNWADPISVDGTNTNIDNNDKSVNNNFMLLQNYPNPFNPTTIIKFSIASGATQSVHTILKIYDVLGQEIRTLLSKQLHAGTYEVEFNAGGLSSGIYFYQLSAANFIDTKKMLLIK